MSKDCNFILKKSLGRTSLFFLYIGGSLKSAIRKTGSQGLAFFKLASPGFYTINLNGGLLWEYQI